MPGPYGNSPFGLQPVFYGRLQNMFAAAKAAGFELGVGGGYRDVQTQINLRVKNGCPDIWESPASSCRVPTAIPGKSRHNFGLAADLTGSAAAKAWGAQHAQQFGLMFNVNGEDWHVEPIDVEHEADLQQGMTDVMEMARQAGSMNDWMNTSADPMNEVSDRLDVFQKILAGGDYSQAGTLADLTGKPPETMTLQQGAGGMQGAAIQGFKDGLPSAGYVPPGEGVERWRGVAEAALKYAGQDTKWVNLLLKRMAQESGGNPEAVNNWDSNAMRGDPSQGLMQNIGSAFPERAAELAGRGIFDGFANIVAAIRYTLQRYGTLAAWAKKGGY